MLFVTGLSMLAQTSQPPVPAPPDPESPDQTQTLSDLTDESASSAAETGPSIPKPPAGILPVSEITRLSYAPSDRPRVRFIGETLVVVTASGAVEGHDAATGEFRFKLGLPGERLLPPVEVEGEIIVASASGTLLRIDPERGTLLAELSLPFALALPPLAVPETRSIYVATPEGDVIGFAMDGLESEPRFRVRTAEPVFALAAGNGVLIVSGAERTLSAIDARTGNPLWHFIGRGGFSPVAFRADGKRVFVGDDLGEFYSLDLENGKVDFHWSTGASIRTAPLVEEKSVFVTSLGNNVYAYDPGGGAERWRAPLPGRPGLGPTRVNEQLVVPTLDGILMEVDIGNGRLGKSHGLGAELGSAPAFLVVPPPEGYFEMLEEMRKEAAAEQAAARAERAGTAEPAEPGGDPVLGTEASDSPEGPLSPVSDEPSGAEAETEPASGGDLRAGPPRPPEWFELSRIAVPLRTGEVVLLGHQAPAPAAETPASPDATPPDVPTEDTTVPNRRLAEPPKPL